MPPKTSTLRNFRLTLPLDREIQNAAARAGETFSAYVRGAVRARLKAEDQFPLGGAEGLLPTMDGTVVVGDEHSVAEGYGPLSPVSNDLEGESFRRAEQARRELEDL